MRSIVIGLVLLFAVFTFVGAMDEPAGQPGTVQAAATSPVP